MSLRPLILAVILSASAILGTHAESIVIEPPPPDSYNEARPEFVYFKKVEITQKSSGSYDVDITLRQPMPNFDKDQGAHFNLAFDFAEISPEKSLPTNRIPDFNEDLIISISRNINESKFDASDKTISYRGRDWDIKVMNLMVRKDSLSFSLRSPLFALKPACRVVFRSNFMRAQSARSASGVLAAETAPISLNPSDPAAPATPN